MLIRPHHEFAVVVWSLLLKQDINSLESVQRRATKQLRDFGKLPYKEQLHRHNLKSPEARREHDGINCRLQNSPR